MKTLLSIITIAFLANPALFSAQSGYQGQIDPGYCEAPTVKKYVEPQIPAHLIEPDEICEITIKVMIDESGKLVAAKMLNCSHHHLEPIVMSAIENWEFTAAKEMGRPKRSTIKVPFRFVVAAK